MRESHEYSLASAHDRVECVGMFARRLLLLDGWVARLLLCPILLIMCAAAQAQSPVPLIANPLVPDVAAPKTAGLTLTVNGTGFISSSVVNWNGSPRATTFVSNHQLTAAILTSDLATQTTATVTVINSGSPASNPAYFAVVSKRASVGFVVSNFGTGSNPVGVAIGDFNKDGNLDLAIANDNDNTVSVQLGNGDGTFGAQTTYDVTGFPLNVVMGDLNNDGNLDLVTVDDTNSHISVLLGNGDGTFQPMSTASTGGHPMSLAIGDLNGDGILDVVTPNYADNTVSVLLGIGNGMFKARVDYPVGMGPLDVKLADVNNDGILDIITVNNTDNTISVLLGNGDGTFQAQTSYSTAPRPNALGVADLNGDGYQDVVTTNGSSTLSVLLNSQLGTFPTHTDYTSDSYPSYVVGLADFNSDGKLDVLVPNFNESELSLYFGNGDGTLNIQPARYAVQANPDALGIADFNKDGLLDVAALDEFANQASILLQSSIPPPRVSPSFIKFPKTEGGMMSAPMNVTVANISNSPLTINSVTLGGGNPDQFSQTNNCVGILGAKSSCTIAVVFAPTAVGSFAATLNVNDSAGTQTVSLSGTGNLTVVIIPDFIHFPLTSVGQSSLPVAVTIQNESGIDLLISSITVTGMNLSDYSQTNNCPASLGPGATCTMNVVFSPTDINLRTATIIILSNSSTPKRGVTLRGKGTEITYSPTALNFGTIMAGTQSTLNVTFSNSGFSALAITGIQLQGRNPGAFSQRNTCSGNIPANGSCVFSVTFSPSAPGTALAQLSVTDADPTSPQIVSLMGMATSSPTHK